MGRFERVNTLRCRWCGGFVAMQGKPRHREDCYNLFHMSIRERKQWVSSEKM